MLSCNFQALVYASVFLCVCVSVRERPVVASSKQTRCLFLCICCVCVCMCVFLLLSGCHQNHRNQGLIASSPPPASIPSQSHESWGSPLTTHTHTHPHLCARTLTLWNWHISTASCFHILQVNISRLVKWDGIPACAGNVPRTICKPSSPPPPNSLQIVKLWISILGYTRRFLTLLSVGHLT